MSEIHDNSDVVGRLPSTGAGIGRVAPRGASPSQPNAASDVVNPPNAASGDAAYNTTRSADVGRVPPCGAAPGGAKEGGDLPGGWRIARVGDILKVRSGYAFKSTDYQPEGVPLIRQSDLGDDVVDIAEAKR